MKFFSFVLINCWQVSCRQDSKLILHNNLMEKLWANEIVKTLFSFVTIYMNVIYLVSKMRRTKRLISS